MKPKTVPITDSLSDVPVMRSDISTLDETTEVLNAAATVLSYVGIAGQVGGDEGELAARTALGVAAALELAAARIEQFQVRQLEVRGGAK
jgi:hypothetical protein